MKTLTFDNGDTLPMLGLGTWKSEPGEVYNAVKSAIEAGYRHIDCAHIYGNEDEIGKALNDVFAAGTVTREELWITSKLWNSDHAPEDVQPAAGIPGPLSDALARGPEARRALPEIRRRHGVPQGATGGNHLGGHGSAGGQQPDPADRCIEFQRKKAAGPDRQGPLQTGHEPD